MNANLRRVLGMGLHHCHWCSVIMCVPVKDELTEYRGAEQIVEKFLLIDITMILQKEKMYTNIYNIPATAYSNSIINPR